MEIIIKGSREEIKQYLSDNSYQSVRNFDWDEIIKPTLIKNLHHCKHATDFSFRFMKSFGGTINE